MAEAPTYESLVNDLEHEHLELERTVSRLNEDQLVAASAARDWSNADQLSHLAGFDEKAIQGVADPDAFSAELADIIEHGRDPIAEFTQRGRLMAPKEVVTWWNQRRAELIMTLRSCTPDLRVPWYGPSMSLKSHVTARLMETWAHGQDIRDSIGEPPLVSSRLRHIADLGVRARPYAYGVNLRELPDTPVRVELVAPDSTTWTWGPESASEVVRGEALDFVLLVTQRRHLRDVSLDIAGDVAKDWMSFAQCFAGGAGPGREPLH